MAAKKAARKKTARKKSTRKAAKKTTARKKTAGRKKTILIDLTRVFRPGTPHRLRLRTNLEIYWDQIQWAPGLSATEVSLLAGLHPYAYASAANTVKVNIHNTSNVSTNLGTMVFDITVIQ